MEFINEELGVKLTVYSSNNVKIESTRLRRESLIGDNRVNEWIDKMIKMYYEQLEN